MGEKQDEEDKRGRGEEEGGILVMASNLFDDGRQQLGRKKKGEKRGCISHGGFEYKQFQLGILSLQLQRDGTFDSSAKQNRMPKPEHPETASERPPYRGKICISWQRCIN